VIEYQLAQQVIFSYTYLRATFVCNCTGPYPPSNMTSVAGTKDLTVDVYPSTHPNTSATNCTLQVYSSDGSPLVFNQTLPLNGNLPIRFYVAGLMSSTDYELRAYMDWSAINSDPFTAFVGTQSEGLY
jgi:hypothetical protein